MKRDLKRIQAIKEFIKENYLSVSDRDIARRFGVSLVAVRTARQRLGLEKGADTVKALRAKRREDKVARRASDFSAFWNG